MNKQCKKCKKTKPINEFYVHAQMTNGRLNICKECVRDRVSKHSQTEHGKEVARMWYKTPKGKAKLSRHTKRFRRLNPEKYKAHLVANNAIRSGKLIKQPCIICGDKKAEKHHDDYSKPLAVKWFCRKHHREYEGR